MQPFKQAAVFVGAVLALWVGAASAETLDEARRAAGLPALRVSSKMALIAEPHARDMARRSPGRCTHASLTHDGFFEVRGPAGAIAENVACGCRTATCAIQRWLASPGHRANILKRDARTYGISHATTPDGRVTYWVMLLGP